MLFDDAKDEPLRRTHDGLLFSQVVRCTENDPKALKGLSVAGIEQILDAIMGYAPQTSLRPGARWFIDITGAPKPYFLGLLGRLRQRVSAPTLSLFYCTGYYEKGGQADDPYSFTSGPDRYIWVPWLWGRPDPALPWTYIFLLGFEGQRSRDVFERFEPRYVKAVIGKPGYRPCYDRIAEEANAAFLKEARPLRIYTNPGDAVETWKRLESVVSRSLRRSNVCFVPLGSKPHALGAGLAALAEGSPAVLYLMPRAFTVRDIPRGNYVWIYEISM